MLMLDLEVLDSFESLKLTLVELLFPAAIEVLHLLFADVDILLHLSPLDVRAERILVSHDLSFNESNFFHEILVELIFLHLAAFLRKQLHFFFHAEEDQ